MPKRTRDPITGEVLTAASPKPAKVAHVLRAGQTRNHRCHWPGCAEQVPPAMWGCRFHWLKLPPRLRSLVWAVYRPGQEDTMHPSREYLAVARRVQEWIKENYGEDR